MVPFPLPRGPYSHVSLMSVRDEARANRSRFCLAGILSAVLPVSHPHCRRDLHHHRRTQPGQTGVSRATLLLRRVRGPICQPKIAAPQFDHLGRRPDTRTGIRSGPAGRVQAVCGAWGSRLLRGLSRQFEETKMWSVSKAHYRRRHSGYGQEVSRRMLRLPGACVGKRDSSLLTRDGNIDGTLS
jgi:hypothetical protein